MKKKQNKPMTRSESQSAGMEFFTFGDPEPVHADRILDYLGTFAEGGGEFYIPPISMSGLAKMRRANGHHGSCILFRRNMAANAYQSGGLTVSEFCRTATDYLTFGNAYLELMYNRFGKIAGIRHVPALNMRVKTREEGFRRLLNNGEFVDYAPHEMIQLAEYDELQQIYGVPDWLGGMQSALLNQEATLFRRRYYVNGAHIGYILYTNDPKMSKETRDKLQQSFREGKGVGNFKASYINIPGGSEKAVQIIPIGDISQRDEFQNIKNISASDVFVAHRVPLALMSVMPQGTGTLGDPEKHVGVYQITEVKSLCRTFESVNDRLPPKLQFKFEYKLEIK